MRLPLLIALLTSTATAGEIRVPADQPDLATALAVAAPGDVIRVQTPADQAPASGASLLVDKPVTIVGEPVCRIDLQGFGLPADGGLKLAGPGHGEVVLMGVELSYQVGFEDGMPSLAGGGFDALRLYDCKILHDNFTPTGAITRAFPAVELAGVAELTVVGSELLGGWRYSDTCIPTFLHGNGEAGIEAPGTSVLLVDSSVTGGSGGGSVEYWLAACPTDLDSLPGVGGDGVVAAELHSWNTTITPGAGTQVWVDPIGFCSSGMIFCGTSSNGQPYIVGGTVSVNGCSRLTHASSRVPLGGVWQLDWDPVGAGCLPSLAGCGTCPAFLFVDLAAPGSPIDFAGSWVYLNPGTAFLALNFPSNLPFSALLPVPPIPVLAGLEVSAQVMIGTGALSGPVSGVLAP